MFLILNDCGFMFFECFLVLFYRRIWNWNMFKVGLICFNIVYVKVRMKLFIKLILFVFVFRLILIISSGREIR